MSETTARRLRLQCEAVLNSFLTFERGREYSSHDADDMPAGLRADLEDYGWDGEAGTYDDFLNEADDALRLTWNEGEPLEVLFCGGGRTRHRSHDADDMPADLRADLEDYGWDGEAWTYDDFLNEADDALSLTWKEGEPLEVLFCCGGPNVYLTYDPIEGAAIEGYWGGDRYALIGPDVDRMAAHWRGLAELLTLD